MAKGSSKFHHFRYGNLGEGRSDAPWSDKCSSRVSVRNRDRIAGAARTITGDIAIQEITFSPILAGAISDAMGSIVAGFWLSPVLLGVAAFANLLQRSPPTSFSTLFAEDV